MKKDDQHKNGRVGKSEEHVKPVLSSIISRSVEDPRIYGSALPV